MSRNDLMDLRTGLGLFLNKPFVNVGFESEHPRTRRIFIYAINGKAELFRPSPTGPDVAPDIIGDFFPGVEPFPPDNHGALPQAI